MSRYFFDMHDASGVRLDAAGEDFQSLDDAIAMCRRLLPDLLHAGLPSGGHHVVACDVRDEAGQTLYQGRLTFDDARTDLKAALVRAA